MAVLLGAGTRLEVGTYPKLEMLDEMPKGIADRVRLGR